MLGMSDGHTTLVLVIAIICAMLTAVCWLNNRYESDKKDEDNDE